MQKCAVKEKYFGQEKLVFVNEQFVEWARKLVFGWMKKALKESFVYKLFVIASMIFFQWVSMKFHPTKPSKQTVNWKNFTGLQPFFKIISKLEKWAVLFQTTGKI